MARISKRRKRNRSSDDTPGWHGRWKALTDTSQHLVCAIALIVIGFGFFAPVHLSDQSLVGGDTVQWRATAEAAIDYRAATGEEPLWNPNTYAGMPAYMISYPEVVPQIDALPRLIRPLLWPTSHLLVLLFGVYLLVVFLTGSKLSGVLAACAYGLTTYLPVILTAGHNTKFVALCFAPWLVLAFAYALRKPKLLSGLLFAIALAVNIRAGHAQITYYVAFLLGLWWVVEGVGAFRNQRLKTFGAATGWLVLGSVLGLLMVAQPLLSQFEYKDYTIRGAATGGGEGGLDWSYAMGWSQGGGELITLLIADAYGGSGGTYWGPKPFTGGPHYVGGVVLLLAVLAVWRLRRNVVYALGIGTLLMMLFALGEHFSLLNRPMFEFFPLFDAFRVPETWLSVVAFALAGLAGFGLAYARRRELSSEAEEEKTKAIYIVAGGAVGLVLLLLGAKSAFFDFERPGEAQQIVQQVVAQRPDLSPDDPRVRQFAQQEVAQREEARVEKFDDDAVRTLIFLVLAGLVLVAYRRGMVPAWAMQAGLVLLVVIDLWGVGRRYVNEDTLRPVQEVEDAVATYEFDRFLLERKQEAGGPGHFRVLSLVQGNPMTNGRPSYYHESLGGYHGAKLRLYQDYIDHLFRDPRTGLPNENALDLLNTRYIVARGQLPGTEVVYENEQTGVVVAENLDAVPRAFFVGETEVVSSPEETWAHLQSDGFDPLQTALLPEPIDATTTPINSSSVADVTLQTYSPREIVWNVETDAPRLLVVSEVYYPAGWKATLDDEQVPIHRVDYLLRAVPVPSGTHTLVMRFEPMSHKAGVWIAGTSTALVYGATLLLLGLAYRRRRTSSSADEEAQVAADA